MTITPDKPGAPDKIRPPARLRAAASLILLRGSGANTTVLMGRRHATVRFMPGVYVFPGGAVDRDDTEVNPATALDPRITAGLKVAGNIHRARALAIAAVRETHEETGLMLGAAGDVAMPESAPWSPWRQQSIAPDLARLQLVGRAITPINRPIRFNARFFYARGEQLHGEIRGDGELEEIGWKPLADLAGLPLADVQAFMIEHLQALLQGQLKRTGIPLFSHRQGRRYVRYQPPG